MSLSYHLWDIARTSQVFMSLPIHWRHYVFVCVVHSTVHTYICACVCACMRAYLVWRLLVYSSAEFRPLLPIFFMWIDWDADKNWMKCSAFLTKYTELTWQWTERFMLVWTICACNRCAIKQLCCCILLRLLPSLYVNTILWMPLHLSDVFSIYL